MDLAQRWSSGVVGYLLVDGLALRLRRVDSEDLARVGHDHLEGSEAYAQVAAAQAAAQKASLLRGVLVQQGMDPSPVLADLAASERRAAVERLHALTDSPEKETALLARCDAYLCAAVDGGAEIAHPGPPTVVSELVDPPAEWSPFRFVRGTGAERQSPGEVEVGRLGRYTRIVAGLAVAALLQGVTRRRVESFPAPPGAAGRAARAGAPVRDDASGGHEVEP